MLRFSTTPSPRDVTVSSNLLIEPHDHVVTSESQPSMKKRNNTPFGPSSKDALRCRLFSHLGVNFSRKNARRGHIWNVGFGKMKWKCKRKTEAWREREKSVVFMPRLRYCVVFSRKTFFLTTVFVTEREHQISRQIANLHTTTSCFSLIHKTFVLMRYVEPFPCFFASYWDLFSLKFPAAARRPLFSLFFCVCRYGIIRFTTAFYYMCLAVCMLFLSLGFRRVSQSIIESFSFFVLSLSLMTPRGSAFFLSFYRKWAFGSFGFGTCCPPGVVRF